MEELGVFRRSRQADLEAKIERLEAKIERRSLRAQYARQLFWLLCGSLVFVYFLLVCQGLQSLGNHSFFLSDKVLIAVISSTTANVIGLFYVVAKYLYPNSSRVKTKNKADEP